MAASGLCVSAASSGSARTALHNLWVQPILDTITRSLTATPADHGKKFTMHMYHFESNGVIDQEVNAVTSIEKHYGSIKTPDHQELGVTTAFCSHPSRPGNPIEPACPDWVNSGPNAL
jgi:hypothetical protein